MVSRDNKATESRKSISTKFQLCTFKKKRQNKLVNVSRLFMQNLVASHGVKGVLLTFHTDLTFQEKVNI